jgi:hypothetical protein
MMHHGMPLQYLSSNHKQRTSMEACEAREHGGDSKQNHQVEGEIMQAKEWTRTFGRCNPVEHVSRSNKASISALEKN